jgi:hypothetical protein
LTKKRRERPSLNDGFDRRRVLKNDSRPGANQDQPREKETENGIYGFTAPKRERKGGK